MKESSLQTKRHITLRLLVSTGIICFIVGTQVGTVVNSTSRIARLFSCNCDDDTIAKNATILVDDSIISSQDLSSGKFHKQIQINKTAVTESKPPLIFSNERLILSPTTTEKIRITHIEYPFIPQRILAACGLDKFQTEKGRKHKLARVPLNHSIAYIKPHKTGSSTIAGLFNRILYGRGAIKMIPRDNTYLGWKTYNKTQFFPGDVYGLPQVLRRSKYDAFVNHAVWTNRTRVAQFLKDPVVTTTILREPLSRTVSALNFFPVAHRWDDYLKRYEHTRRIATWQLAMLRNNLAYALGWYCQPHIDFKTSMDRNETLIRQFIEKVDVEMDLVMVLERMPESLLLLREEGLTELDVSELVWTDYDGNTLIDKAKKKEYPNDKQTARLKEMLYLDQTIYNHFRDKFDKRWEAAITRKPELLEMRDALQCTRDKLHRNFDNRTLPAITRQFYFGMTGAQFTWLLHQRQIQKFKK
jgi:hypothetical protein